MRLRLWLAGLAAGVAGMAVLLVAPLGGLLAVVPLWTFLALRPPRPAAAAGLVVALGAIFVAGWYDGRQRCAAMGPSCEFGDNGAQLAMAWAALAVGIVLTALALRGHSPTRA